MCVDNHTHIRHIILYHFEKEWKTAQSFRYFNELFWRRNNQLMQLMNLPISNLTILS